MKIFVAFMLRKSGFSVNLRCKNLDFPDSTFIANKEKNIESNNFMDRNEQAWGR